MSVNIGILSSFAFAVNADLQVARHRLEAKAPPIGKSQPGPLKYPAYYVSV